MNTIKQKKQRVITYDNTHETHFETVPTHLVSVTHYGWDVMIDGSWVNFLAADLNELVNRISFVNVRKTFAIDSGRLDYLKLKEHAPVPAPIVHVPSQEDVE